MNAEPLTERLLAILGHLRILPRRILLDTPGVLATIPMLRGVWGAALHELDPAVYRAVFAPNEGSPVPAARRPASTLAAHVAAARKRQDMAGLPRGETAEGAKRTGPTAPASYVLRPAPPDPHFAPAMEWILIGDAMGHDAVLCRAWDIASGMGLGPQRRRFHLRRALVLRPDGTGVEGGDAWRLREAAWPLYPGCQACRLVFPSPLRLIRYGRLIEQPTFSDIVIAACRRVRAYLPPNLHATWDALSREALEASRSVPFHAWQGGRLDLHRYSASQAAELDLRGVAGWLELPAGPGPLWPLLAASQWLHVGKGSVMGMGQLQVQPP